MPPVCRQSGTVAAIRLGLQSGQFPAQSSGETDQDGVTDCAPRPAVRLPAG